MDVATEILRKPKRDAEELHFHAAVERAVLTCPAAFTELERQRLEYAGKAAGFREVRLREEPVPRSPAPRFR